MNDAHVVVIATGGTIEKIYDEHTGEMVNVDSVLASLIGSLQLVSTSVELIELCNVDSRDMTADDHQAVATAAHEATRGRNVTGVVVAHGTDRLAESAETTLTAGVPRVPIVFTGAMRPASLARSDASQNMSEALLATRLVEPGVYVAMHGTVLQFPGVVKDVERLRFVRSNAVGVATDHGL